MIVSIEDLGNTELYPEVIEKITRGNQASAELQLSQAESLVRSYMSKYNVKKIFDPNSDPEDIPDLPLVKKMILIVASWYLVKKANPNVNIELFKADFEDVIDWLKDLQAGKVNPNLPYAEDDPATPEDESNREVAWNSNIKRNNFF